MSVRPAVSWPMCRHAATLASRRSPAPPQQDVLALSARLETALETVAQAGPRRCHDEAHSLLRALETAMVKKRVHAPRLVEMLHSARAVADLADAHSADADGPATVASSVSNAHLFRNVLKRSVPSMRSLMPSMPPHTAARLVALYAELPVCHARDDFTRIACGAVPDLGRCDLDALASSLEVLDGRLASNPCRDYATRVTSHVAHAPERGVLSYAAYGAFVRSSIELIAHAERRRASTVQAVSEQARRDSLTARQALDAALISANGRVRKMRVRAAGSTAPDVEAQQLVGLVHACLPLLEGEPRAAGGVDRGAAAAGGGGELGLPAVRAQSSRHAATLTRNIVSYVLPLRQTLDFGALLTLVRAAPAAGRELGAEREGGGKEADGAPAPYVLHREAARRELSGVPVDGLLAFLDAPGLDPLSAEPVLLEAATRCEAELAQLRASAPAPPAPPAAAAATGAQAASAGVSARRAHALITRLQRTSLARDQRWLRGVQPGADRRLLEATLSFARAFSESLVQHGAFGRALDAPQRVDALDALVHIGVGSLDAVHVCTELLRASGDIARLDLPTVSRLMWALSRIGYVGHRPHGLWSALSGRAAAAAAAEHADAHSVLNALSAVCRVGLYETRAVRTLLDHALRHFDDVRLLRGAALAGRSDSAPGARQREQDVAKLFECLGALDIEAPALAAHVPTETLEALFARYALRRPSNPIVSDLQREVGTALRHIGARCLVEPVLELPVRGGALRYRADFVLEGLPVVLEVQGAPHYLFSLTAAYCSMRNRLLRRRGFAVIEVPHETWNQLRARGGGLASLGKFLLRRISQAGVLLPTPARAPGEGEGAASGGAAAAAGSAWHDDDELDMLEVVRAATPPFIVQPTRSGSADADRRRRGGPLWAEDFRRW